jgi:hypothetical protein
VEVVRGTVLHCSRFGAVIRLEDGRLATMPSEQAGMSAVRRATTGGRRPQFPFVVEEDSGRHVRLALAEPPRRDVEDEVALPASPARASSSLEQKIIDYLRQSAERDPRAAAAEMARAEERGRPDRLLPFEYRARSQYRDSPERPRRPKR